MKGPKKEHTTHSHYITMIFRVRRIIAIMELLLYCELAIRRNITLTQQLAVLNTTWFADYQFHKLVLK